MSVEVAEAYSHCEAVTRREAANFYYGIRLLDRDRRRAMCAVYAFARRVDDIGDGELAHEHKLRLLDGEESALLAMESRPDASQTDPVMVALADAQVRFQLPPGVLGELIEGVRMDVGGIAYESFDDLVLYCRRVAGAIGRVCLAIFGVRGDAAQDMAHAHALADDLGVALQLTNILRDVREDAQNGRVYLPAEDLRRYGLIAAGGEDDAPARLAELAQHAGEDGDRGRGGRQADLEQVSALIHFEAARAREWFQRGLALGGLLDRRSAACVLAMAGIYSRLLDRIEADPERAFARRVSLPPHEKAWVAVRGMIGVGG
ncbi:MAG: phytoene/squalene synthase family protein [Solirubrobacteraceae bacterium]